MTSGDESGMLPSSFSSRLRLFYTLGVEMVQAIESALRFLGVGPILDHLVSFLELFAASFALDGYPEVAVG